MKLICSCAWWGLDHLGLEGMLKKIKQAGFDAVEIGIPQKRTDQEALKSYLDIYDLKLIVHHYDLESRPLKEYLSFFKESLEKAAAFQPLLINSHTGKDFWSFEEGVRTFELAEEVSQKYDITVAHETHRGRILYSAPVARQYMEALPFLKINADFSHWVNVSESLMEGQEDTMELAINRTEHTHARVGFAEGPQVPDPRAPEWKEEMDIFTQWWIKILKRFIAEDRDCMTITPEFGPVPYTIREPFTLKPLSDPWEINVYMKEYLKEQFDPFLKQ